MNVFKQLQIALCLVLFLIPSGCYKSDLEEAEKTIDRFTSEYLEVKSEIVTLTTQNTKLTDEVSLLKNQVRELEAENYRLVTSHADVDEWADTLVEGYGPGIWYTGQLLYPRFLKRIKSGSVSDVVEELNKRFRKDNLPEVILLSSESGRVEVGVSDDEHLTMRMGSHGASSYMKAVTFSITSIKGVDCIWFKFEEADHASPGKYCRRLFQKNIKTGDKYE